MADQFELEPLQTGDRSVAQRISATLRADPNAYIEVGSDASDDRTTALMVGLVGLTAGLLSSFAFIARLLLFSSGQPGVDPLLAGIQLVVAAYVAWLVGTRVFLRVGRMFGGASDYRTLLRGNAYASLPMAVAPIPIVGWALGLWSMYLFVVNVRANMAISTGRSVLVVLLPIGVVALIVFLVVLSFLMALMTIFTPAV